MSNALAGKPCTSSQSNVQVNKVLNIDNTPQSTNVFSNVTFNNCNVTVNYT